MAENSVTGQSKKHSLVEAWANAILGYVIGVGSQALLLPYAGCTVSVESNLVLGIAFAAVSVVRSYVLRRIAEGITRWSRFRKPATEPSVNDTEGKQNATGV